MRPTQDLAVCYGCGLLCGRLCLPVFAGKDPIRYFEDRGALCPTSTDIFIEELLLEHERFRHISIAEHYGSLLEQAGIHAYPNGTWTHATRSPRRHSRIPEQLSTRVNEIPTQSRRQSL